MNSYKLGELITQRREKNNEEGLPIRGVSREGLIPPKQIDADTSIYNVFYKNDFIFNPARMELNSIAFNDEYEKAICSSLYEVFYVHREDLVLPEYLRLIVKQDWFTRYCEFLGQGSAREYCRFANISEINIDLPDIETQNMERNLTEKMPNVRWSVKNQARMHSCNGDLQYVSLEDAVSKWPEIASAILVRKDAEGGYKFVAPFGYDDLLRLIVRPTPHFCSKIDKYQERVAKHDWQSKWKKLIIMYTDISAT